MILSGNTLSGAQFAAILAAMPQLDDNASGQPRPSVPTPVFCDETVFVDHIDIQHVVFQKYTSFTKAEFRQGAQFNGVQFRSEVSFHSAVFRKDASLSNLTVDGSVNMVRVTADCTLNLMQSKIAGDLDLQEIQCSGLALGHSEVNGNVDATGGSFTSGLEDYGHATFHRTKFHKDAIFDRAQFPAVTVFGERDEAASVGLALSLQGATFGSERAGAILKLEAMEIPELRAHDLKVFGALSLRGSTVSKPLSLTDIVIHSTLQPQSEIAARKTGYDQPDFQLDLRSLVLPAGGELRSVRVDGRIAISLGTLDKAFAIVDLLATQNVQIEDTTFLRISATLGAGTEVVFHGCQFSQGGTVRCSGSELKVELCDAPKALTIASDPTANPTVLTSLDGTNVENFVLSRLDLSQTLFAGCMNLDKVTIEGASIFARGPLWTGNRRELIREEALVRASRSKRWKKNLGPGPNRDQITPARSVAATYRALRKSREDGKDEPGGSDFYYGEMEMRRMASPRWSIEKILLTAYWVFSGYALRAWRSFAFLLVFIVGAAYLLSIYGFTIDPPPDWLAAGRQLALASVALQRSPDHLTVAGDAIFIVGRLAVPALIALTLFALRGRVKR